VVLSPNLERWAREAALVDLQKIADAGLVAMDGRDERSVPSSLFKPEAGEASVPSSMAHYRAIKETSVERLARLRSDSNPRQ